MSARPGRRPRVAVALAGAVAAAGAALLVAPSAALACGSCRGPSGPGASVTASWERWGVGLMQRTRFGLGAFDAASTFRPLGSGTSDAAGELSAYGGYRVLPGVELAAVVPAGFVRVSAPGFSTSRASLGDVVARARWEVLSEPAWPFDGSLRRPSLALGLTVRTPTGAVDRAGGTGTVGSTASSLGLGAWEGALAADSRATLGRSWQLGLAGEVALRAPDSAIGRERQLGPRVLARALALHFEGPYTFGVNVDVSAEGSVAYDGRLARASGQRMVSLGASVGFRSERGVRSTVGLSYEPPLDGLGLSSVSAVGLTVGVAFTR